MILWPGLLVGVEGGEGVPTSLFMIFVNSLIEVRGYTGKCHGRIFFLTSFSREGAASSFGSFDTKDQRFVRLEMG